MGGLGFLAQITPEVLIESVLDAFKERFNVTVETVEAAKENVSFKVPKILREMT